MTLVLTANITTGYDKVIILGGRSFMYTMKVWALEFALVGIKFFLFPSLKKNSASLQFYFNFPFSIY